MQPLAPAQAEEVLTHFTHPFAQGRQSRRTARGRSPPRLWEQAVALTATFSVPRVATQLGLTPQALQRRRDALHGTPAPTSLPSSSCLVEVTAAWRPPATEGEGQRSDGPRLRLTYSEASPALVPL